MSLSPNGQYIAGIRADGDNDQLVIINWRTREAQALQILDRRRGAELTSVAWKSDDRLVFTLSYDVRVRLGNETRPSGVPVERVLAIDRTGENLALMFESQQNRLAVRYAPTVMVDRLPNDPNFVLIATVDRSGALTLWRANIATGRASRVAAGAYDTIGWVTDGNGEPALRQDALPRNSGYRIFRRSGDDWILVREVRRADSLQTAEFNPLSPGPGDGRVYVIARPDNADMASLYLFDAQTGEFGEPIFSDPQADVYDAWVQPRSRGLIAACSYRQLLACRARDPEVQRHLDAINRFFERNASVSLISMSDDGEYWLLEADGPRNPTAFFIYDRQHAHIEPVAAGYHGLNEQNLSPARIVEYQARDGRNLWGYLTTPTGAAAPYPLVVMPHGGPESRDYFFFDFVVQFLASRGYAVFQPQFRGSEGFGRAFASAGYRQWGQLMQDDVTDGVRHLIASGDVDASRMCIVGFSYGGYAALAGAALTPDMYRCAASIAGVSDLGAMLRWTRAEQGRGSLVYDYWTRVMGDPVRDRDMLARVSPAALAAETTTPILLMHGAEDEIVPIEQSEIMRDALAQAGRYAEYVALPGEGHSPHGWSETNRVRLLRELDAFLARNNGPS